MTPDHHSERARPADSTELDLLAQAYVLGELDAAATADFELRLGDDLAACEAVARAVALIAAVRTPHGAMSPAAPIRSIARARAWRIAAAAVACIAIGGAAVWFAGGRSAGLFGELDPQPIDPEQWIASWIDLGDADAFADSLPDLIETENDATEFGAPGWLLTVMEEVR